MRAARASSDARILPAGWDRPPCRRACPTDHLPPSSPDAPFPAPPVQVTTGIAEVHRYGVLHRDLKPENVQLVEVAGEQHLVKILDFGLARLCAGGGEFVTPVTRTGAILGTPQHMAPEQCAGTVVDGRADINAIGVMLYELLAGKVPFDGPSLTVMFKQVQEQPQPLFWQRPDLPPALATLVMRCLAKSPDDRPPNPEALLAALQEAAGVSAPGSEEAVHLPRPLDESDAFGQLETAWAEDTVTRATEEVQAQEPSSIGPTVVAAAPQEEEAELARPTAAARPGAAGAPGSRRTAMVVATVAVAAALLGGGAWALWVLYDGGAPSGEEAAAKATSVARSSAATDSAPAEPGRPPTPATTMPAPEASTAPASSQGKPGVRPTTAPPPPPTPRATA
ncbi:MAG: hypothetical protein FJ125_06255, partial [Deltaproteobacteria bacterium]|nr:hypothetical protein [Deltaproteobacteria bacterium]